MSHFIIRFILVFIFGIPKGQASTQLLHAMQRGLRAVWTTPSSVFLIASAGHTSAQVGESQCMHTTGTVWVEWTRSRKSTWIIDCPLWVSHSVQAWMQDWHPMQRPASMKDPRVSGTGISQVSANRKLSRDSRAAPDELQRGSWP